MPWGGGPWNRSSILGRKIVLPFTETSGLVLGSTYLSIQSVPQEILPGVNRPESKAVSGTL